MVCPRIPKKQRHTAKRIHERLQTEGYEGGYTVVKEVVRELRRTTREVYMPLVHRPGEAQVDYFFALARLGGKLQKVAIFLMALPYSDAFFLMCTPRECTETFWEGHVRAFKFFGGVPSRISYDNSRIAVRSIIGVHRRKLTDAFLELASHYLYDYHFCTVRRPNEKGLVEGTGKYARLNFLVPVPEMADYDELNAYLHQRCEDDLDRRLRGHTGTKRERLEEDRAAFGALPEAAFAACAQGRKVRFWTVTQLVRQLLESREERSLQRLFTQLERHHLLVLDELGDVPFTKAGPSCCSKWSAGLTSARAFLSPPTSRSRAGPRCSDRSG